MDVTARSPKAGWAHLEHGADIGVRGFGATRSAAFEQAALALTAVVCDPAAVAIRDGVSIECEAGDDETLLFDWLNAVIFEMATRRMLFGTYAVEIDGFRLRGRARGEAVERARHRPAAEVKGATYTGLKVEREGDGRWIAECVVDV